MYSIISQHPLHSWPIESLLDLALHFLSLRCLPSSQRDVPEEFSPILDNHTLTTHYEN